MPREKKTHVGAQVNYGKCKIPITVSPVSLGKCLRKERATRAESESEIWGEREIEEEKETEDIFLLGKGGVRVVQRHREHSEYLVFQRLLIK